MKQFSYVIADPLGIHARPAMELARLAGQYKSQITMEREERKADVKNLMALMGLGVHVKDTVKVTSDGEDESEAIVALEHFLRVTL